MQKKVSEIILFCLILFDLYRLKEETVRKKDVREFSVLDILR